MARARPPTGPTAQAWVVGPTLSPALSVAKIAEQHQTVFRCLRGVPRTDRGCQEPMIAVPNGAESRILLSMVPVQLVDPGLTLTFDPSTSRPSAMFMSFQGSS